MQEFINGDRELLLFLNGLGSPTYDHIWLMLTDKWIWVPLYVILLYLIYKSYRLRSFIFIIIFVAIGIAISDQLANIFKNGIARLRPCHDEELMSKMRLVICGGKYGFYSAHAATSFFVATLMTILLKDRYRFFPYFIFLWAILISYSRIYLGVHFPFDVGFGALVGTLLGGFIATLSLNVIAKQKLNSI